MNIDSLRFSIREARDISRCRIHLQGVPGPQTLRTISGSRVMSKFCFPFYKRGYSKGTRDRYLVQYHIHIVFCVVFYANLEKKNFSMRFSVLQHSYFDVSHDFWNFQVLRGRKNIEIRVKYPCRNLADQLCSRYILFRIKIKLP